MNMKHVYSIVIASLLLCTATAFMPASGYVATKNGITVEAIDCGRSSSTLCLEALLGELVQNYVGKGIAGSHFMAGGLRPVSITIMNNTDKPMMLASYYGMKVMHANVIIDQITAKMITSQRIYLGIIAGFCGYFSLACGAVAIMDRSAFLATFAALLATSTFISGGVSLILNSFAKHFSTAMTSKFEELNFKEETLIMPGKTIKKLLIAQNEAFISRFPLVIYSLEDRQNMIVFDVDLRA